MQKALFVGDTVVMRPQVGLLKAGRQRDIAQETRLFDEARQETVSMRTKEGANP